MDKQLPHIVSYIQSHTRLRTNRLSPDPFLHITIHKSIPLLHIHRLQPSPFLHITIHKFIPRLHAHRLSPDPFLHITMKQPHFFLHTHSILMFTSLIYHIQASTQSIIYLHICHMCMHTYIYLYTKYQATTLFSLAHMIFIPKYDN